MSTFIAWHHPHNTLNGPVPDLRPAPTLRPLRDISQRSTFTAFSVRRVVGANTGADDLKDEYARKRSKDTSNISSTGHTKRQLRSCRRTHDQSNITLNLADDDLEIVYPCIRTPTAQPTDSERPQQRDWIVQRIVDKMTTKEGFSRWLVEWELITVPASAVNKGTDEMLRVFIHGLMWYGIVTATPVPPDAKTDDERCTVKWEQRWCWTWSLSGSRQSMRRYIEHHPGTLGNMHDEPRFWLESSKLGPYTLPPVTSSGPTGDFGLVGNYFCPENHLDYTMSFYMYCLSSIEHLRRNSKRLLNVPIRQRLTFRSSLACSERASRVWCNVRRLLAYVVGQARHWPCSYCEDGNEAMPKCVTEDSEFGGACINCSLPGKALTCKWHHKCKQCVITRRHGPVIDWKECGREDDRDADW
ncbi:hypothetical protein DOTSEDRAFT_39691 [Dothistroma septosporum NZE10]|uniref:Uncharacterized protein n=1 Tax=Dothistroma septosporum (strain NZE10 / CBS 128990) TaxID=675120 RepID=M2XGG2_DOTSN|nr:hypothetical protein DOTSEDRAFT_39691 [Dothistroma septosporum NZE10]